MNLGMQKVSGKRTFLRSTTIKLEVKVWGETLQLFSELYIHILIGNMPMIIYFITMLIRNIPDTYWKHRNTLNKLWETCNSNWNILNSDTYWKDSDTNGKNSDSYWKTSDTYWKNSDTYWNIMTLIGSFLKVIGSIPTIIVRIPLLIGISQDS